MLKYNIHWLITDRELEDEIGDCYLIYRQDEIETKSYNRARKIFKDKVEEFNKNLKPNECASLWLDKYEDDKREGLDFECWY